MSSVHHISTETAYDLAQAHWGTMLHLANGPMTKDDLIAQLGDERVLDRLLRHGLVQQSGDRFCAVASQVYKTRQESMMTFLKTYVLPTLEASTSEEQHGTYLHSLYLKLDEQLMSTMRRERIRDFLANKLDAISEAPAQGELSPLTIMFVGTSDVETCPTVSAQTLTHLRNASKQRAHNANEAVLTHASFLADSGRYLATLQACEEFSAALQPFAVPANQSNYHLTLAFSWQGIAPVHGETNLC